MGEGGAQNLKLLEEIFAGARELKQRIYGNRIVLFAPLYIGNDCINDCQYCGFRRTNPEVSRRTLSLQDLDREVEARAVRAGEGLGGLAARHCALMPEVRMKLPQRSYSARCSP